MDTGNTGTDTNATVGQDKNTGNSAEQTRIRIDETRAGLARGWRYTPLREGKRPYLMAWPTRSDDAAKQLEYAERGNVGLITGSRSDIDVIDLDGEAAGRIDEFPATVTVITGGGGRHLYYQHDPKSGVKNWVGELGDHIDIRTTGGQVVAVGSVTKQPYTWMPGRSPDDMDFAPFPVELCQRMYDELHPAEDKPAPRKPATRPASQNRRSKWLASILDKETTAIANAPKGTRNATLNRSAYNLGQIVAAGELSEADAEGALTAAASGWIGDECTSAEIEETIRSGLSAGKRNPRPRNRLPGAVVAGGAERQEPDGGADAYADSCSGEAVIEIPEGYEARNTPETRAEATAAPRAGHTRPTPASTGHHIDPFSPANTGERFQSGEINTDYNRIMLDPKKTLPTAQAYIRIFHSHPEHRTIVFCNGLFFQWHGDQNCWREVDEIILRRDVRRWLNECLRYHTTPQGTKRPVRFDSNKQTVDGAIDALTGEAAIDKKTPLPSWLKGTGESIPPRPLSECIAFKSATLHIPTEEIYPPTPCYWIQNALEFNYDGNAPTPEQWLAFLFGVLGGDAEQIALLQEWFGYCLTADMSQHKIFLFQGPPRSGKGVTSRILERLVGLSNVCSPSVQSLATDFGLHAFVGKSLAVFGDAKWTSREAALAVGHLLRISGGDGVNINRKHLDEMTNVRLPTRIMILSNDMPNFRDASGAMANRFLIVRSFVSHLDHEDPSLEAKLATELPGILLWAIEGWKRLRANGRFTKPAIMTQEIEDLVKSSSSVRQFVDEKCTLIANGRTTTTELNEAYAKWCGENGINKKTPQQLGQELKAAFPGVYRGEGTGRMFYYYGISINVEI